MKLSVCALGISLAGTASAAGSVSGKPTVSDSARPGFHPRRPSMGPCVSTEREMSGKQINQEMLEAQYKALQRDPTNQSDNWGKAGAQIQSKYSQAGDQTRREYNQAGDQTRREWRQDGAQTKKGFVNAGHEVLEKRHNTQIHQEWLEQLASDGKLPADDINTLFPLKEVK
ncbi:MAG: hypothetical protein ISQ13_02400 [Candidatus Margulisbacteria bacterium]|nr:hypothetical protein [Candidatus Margulisiibacteriota bacterium]